MFNEILLAREGGSVLRRVLPLHLRYKQKSWISIQGYDVHPHAFELSDWCKKGLVKFDSVYTVLKTILIAKNVHTTPFSCNCCLQLHGIDGYRGNHHRF